MTAAITNLVTVVGDVITLVEGNTILCVCFAAPVFGIAISAVKKLVGKY